MFTMWLLDYNLRVVRITQIYIQYCNESHCTITILFMWTGFLMLISIICKNRFDAEFYVIQAKTISIQGYMDYLKIKNLVSLLKCFFSKNHIFIFENYLSKCLIYLCYFNQLYSNSNCDEGSIQINLKKYLETCGHKIFFIIFWFMYIYQSQRSMTGWSGKQVQA